MTIMYLSLFAFNSLATHASLLRILTSLLCSQTRAISHGLFVFGMMIIQMQVGLMPLVSSSILRKGVSKFKPYVSGVPIRRQC